MCIRQLTPPLGGENEHRSNPPVDINKVIRLDRTGIETDVVKCLFMLRNMRSQGLEHSRTIMKRHRAKSRSADVVRIVQHTLNIEGIITSLGNHLTRDSA